MDNGHETWLLYDTHRLNTSFVNSAVESRRSISLKLHRVPSPGLSPPLPCCSAKGWPSRHHHRRQFRAHRCIVSCYKSAHSESHSSTSPPQPSQYPPSFFP